MDCGGRLVEVRRFDPGTAGQPSRKRILHRAGLIHRPRPGRHVHRDHRDQLRRRRRRPGPDRIRTPGAGYLPPAADGLHCECCGSWSVPTRTQPVSAQGLRDEDRTVIPACRCQRWATLTALVSHPEGVIDMGSGGATAVAPGVVGVDGDRGAGRLLRAGRARPAQAGVSVGKPEDVGASAAVGDRGGTLHGGADHAGQPLARCDAGRERSHHGAGSGRAQGPGPGESALHRGPAG